MAFKPSYNKENGRFKILVRLSYFRGFEKTTSFENGALKYRTNGLISKKTPDGEASKKVVNEAIVDLIKKTWSDKDPKKMKEALGDHPKGRWPLFDGDKYVTDDGEVREGYKDQHFLKLTNDKKIKYKNRRGEDIDREEAEDLFRSGYWAVAYGHLFPVKEKDKGGNGIFVTCDALQFYKRDEEFAGGGIDDDEIDDLGDDEDEDDLGSADDDDDDL